MENNSVASTTPVYTLSVTADLSGIPVHSIRQYIDKGLMIPFKKESSRNLFSQVDILRLKYIHKLLDERWLKHCRYKDFTGSYSLLGNQAMLR